MAANLVFELVDGVMVPRFSGEADGARFFNLAQAARREKRSQKQLRTLHLQVFAPFMTVADEGDPVHAKPIAAGDAWSDVALAMLHQHKFPQCTDVEFKFLIEQCHQWALSPWSRHVFVKWEWDYGDEERSKQEDSTASETAADGSAGDDAEAMHRDGQRLRVLTTIDGLRAAASLAGKVLSNKVESIYGDDRLPLYVDYTIVVDDLDGSPHRTVTARANWSEFAPDEGADSTFWDKMPEHMLEKCAEAKCLRRAFPRALGDLYTVEEWRNRTKKRHSERMRRMFGDEHAGASGAKAAAQLYGEDVVDDKNFPQTPIKFHGQLQELGFKLPEDRNAVVARLMLEWPGLIESDRAAFYARALATIRRNPDRYGATKSG